MRDKEGLIPKLIRDWRFKKQFTKEELDELNKIKKETFMIEMRKKAMADGIEMAGEQNAKR